MADTPRADFREALTLEHRFSTPVALVIEPWASQVMLAPNQMYEIVAKAPAVGSLHVDFGAAQITIYAWPGSTLRVLKDGEPIVECSIPVPSIPPGTRMR